MVLFISLFTSRTDLLMLEEIFFLKEYVSEVVAAVVLRQPSLLSELACTTLSHVPLEPRLGHFV